METRQNPERSKREERRGKVEAGGQGRGEKRREEE
jgi:hypothetical protein